MTAQYDLVARHYNLKRILLGYDALYDYDRYAPITVTEDESEYNWTEAREIVSKAYTAFNPRVGEIVARFFDENWIHAALLPNVAASGTANANDGRTDVRSDPRTITANTHANAGLAISASQPLYRQQNAIALWKAAIDKGCDDCRVVRAELGTDRRFRFHDL